MVRAQTTREQDEIAKREKLALVAFACQSGGTFSCDGPIDHGIAKALIRLMGLVIVDRVDKDRLWKFVDGLTETPDFS